MYILNILVSILFLVVFGALTYFVGKTLLNTINNYIKLNKKVYWAIYSIISLSYIVASMFYDIISEMIKNFLLIIGSFYLAFFMYALIIFPITILINKYLNKHKLYSRKVLSIEVITILIFYIVTGTLGYRNAMTSYVNTISLSREDVSLDKPLNIVMISDIHLGNIINTERLHTMVNEINSLNPDVVIIPGDIIDTHIEPFLNENMATEFSNIKSKYGTFATLGNHDIYSDSINTLISKLEENNVTILRDEAKLIDNSFYIIGRDDVAIESLGNKRKDLNSITNELDSSKCKIVVDHNPKYINDSLEANANIQLSGHTHNGQIFPGNLITKALFEIDHGYLKKDNLNVIVSSGYGLWGPPFRIGSQSEIINIKID